MQWIGDPRIIRPEQIAGQPAGSCVPRQPGIFSWWRSSVTVRIFFYTSSIKSGGFTCRLSFLNHVVAKVEVRREAIVINIFLDFRMVCVAGQSNAPRWVDR